MSGAPKRGRDRVVASGGSWWCVALRTRPARAFCGGSWGDGVCLNYDHFGSHAPWKRPLYVTWVVAVQLRSLPAGVLCAV